MFISKDDIKSFHNFIYAIVLPSNGSYREDGSAILDDELTKEYGKIYPNLALGLGDKIELYGSQVFYFEQWNLFTFPIKDVWFNKPELSIIEKSCINLKQLPEYISGRPILMPKLGCYPGGLDWKDVASILEYYTPDIMIISKD